MSWDWQWNWWECHGAALGATLQLIAVYSDRALVGLAPFYSRRVRIRGLLRSCRLEIIGTAWRDASAAFSDYLDVIVDREHRAAVLESLGMWLGAQSFWTELVVSCTVSGSAASQLVRRHVASLGYVREVDPSSGWCARLPERFEDYLTRLTPAVRRKLFLHRKKLPGIEAQWASAAEVADFLEALWRYSALRWGNSGPAPHVRTFHLRLAAGFARTGELRLSRLCVPGSPARSVLYAVRKGGTVYYLQSGFDTASGPGSPGYLHFGYAIEAACGEQAERFDFLAGEGRHRDYKQDLLTERVPVVTYHAVRGLRGRLLYAGYEALTRGS